MVSPLEELVAAAREFLKEHSPPNTRFEEDAERRLELALADVETRLLEGRSVDAAS